MGNRNIRWALGAVVCAGSLVVATTGCRSEKRSTTPSPPPEGGGSDRKPKIPAQTGEAPKATGKKSIARPRPRPGVTLTLNFRVRALKSSRDRITAIAAGSGLVAVGGRTGQIVGHGKEMQTCQGKSMAVSNQ